MDQNKLIFKRFYEKFVNGGDEQIADEIVDPAVVSHSPFPGQAAGAEGVKETFRLFRKAFPDLHASIEDLLAEGDKVMGRFIVTGTHKGEFMGHAPTGNKISYEEVVIFRFKDGKIAEHWAVVDSMALMQSVGA